MFAIQPNTAVALRKRQKMDVVFDPRSLYVLRPAFNTLIHPRSASLGVARVRAASLHPAENYLPPVN